MRTWLLLGCLVAGIALCIRAPFRTVQQRPLRNTPGRSSALCALEGRTVHSATGQPLANVHIRLHYTNPQRARQCVAIADATGHFRFPDLEPGVYRLDAQRTGNPPFVYGSSTTSSEAETIALSAGQRVKDLEIRLIPAASIAGTVIDRRNRIVARARVGVEETRHKGGALRVVRTDVRGKFRIGLLPPGRYRITAEPDAESTPPSSIPNSKDTPSGRILTVLDHVAVAPAVVVVVEIEAGEQLSDVQILLTPSGGMLRLALT